MNCNTLRYAPILLAFLSVACGYDNGDRTRNEPNDLSNGDIVQGTIDPDAKLTDVESGAGVFVEYATGGTWTMRVGCDTATTDTDCFWQIYAYTPVGVPITSIQSIDLEKNDVLSVKSDGELWLDAIATTDLDGVTFATKAGEPVTFDVYLDGENHPEDLFFYIRNGEVVNGAKFPIVELTPSEP